MQLEYYKVEKQQKKRSFTCPHNEACRCMVRNCKRCGWNPEVEKRRKEAQV